MIDVELKLRCASRPLRDAVAWYRAGGVPSRWLEEIVAARGPQQKCKILPVPNSPGDRQVSGVLVTWHDEQPGCVPSGWIPYGRIADRLFLPVDAALEPDVSDAELDSLLGDDKLYVWHPATGISGFEPHEALSLADLVQPFVASARNWNCARTGIGFARRLTAILPEESQDAGSVLDEGRDDIGTESRFAELPPSPQEPRTDIFNSIARGGRRMTAEVVRWLADRAPGGASGPTWIDQLDRWARRQLDNINAGLDAARNREIARLMHLLESDPDRGLKYALPMGGDAHRGVAPPGGNLARRDVDFNLARLGGGEPADYWDLPPHYHYQLVARYRELAKREVDLGRHRRAAYILAELLGDLSAAASALESGGHWREAAVLHRDRLQRPLEAARCFEQGGLWSEAIALYEEQSEFEKVGDLYRLLGQTDAAALSYRSAVLRHRAHHDLLAAAKVLDEKLAAPDEAVECLTAGWPDSPQSAQCASAIIRLHERQGQHNQSMLWIARFRHEPLPPHSEMALFELLADTATSYPDERVKSRAAECTRVLASRRLPTATRTQSRQILASVERLVPEDRLHARDCRRFSEGQSEPLISPVVPQRASRKKPRLLHSLKLPSSGISWQSAVACDETIICAGVRDDQLVLNRTSWDTVDSAVKVWRIEPTPSPLPVLLAAAPLTDSQVLVHMVGSHHLTSPLQHIFRSSDVFSETLKVGAVYGGTAGLFGAARTEHGVTWLVELRNSEWTLIAYGENHELLSSAVIPRLDTDDEDLESSLVLPVPIHARKSVVYLGIGKQLMVFDRAQPKKEMTLNGRIMSLTGSMPNTRTRLAATMERGGQFIWEDFEGLHVESFASEFDYPIACVNRGGYLIVAAENRCEIYGTHNRRLQLEGETNYLPNRPIAMLPSPRVHQFAVFNDIGEILVYEI